jgi:hypothetical protein
LVRAFSGRIPRITLPKRNKSTRLARLAGEALPNVDF